MSGPAADPGLTNLRWAFALVDGLASAGVRYAVISPGSRSTPLVLACERHPLVETRVHLDERGAAFLALGLALGSGAPVAVVATSGSAPAHWYPAVLEASLSRVPLLLLSANRPPELQGWGANQTLDQQRLFGVHARAFHQAGLPEEGGAPLRQIRQLGIRVVEQARWPQPGPVHVDLPFREPLVPAADQADWPAAPGEPFAVGHPLPEPDAEQIRALAGRISGRPGLIVCGPGTSGAGFPDAVIRLARRLGAPILADPLSGLRFGPWEKERVLARYDTFLRRYHGAGPAWILRFGNPPVSKTLLEYLGGQVAFHALVAPDGGWPDPLHRTGQLLRADAERVCERLAEQPLEPVPGAWTADFRAVEIGSAPDLETERRSDRPFEGLIVRELIETLPPGALLFSGNSQPIRQIDTWSGGGDKPLRILCNRGASGIDGNVSTLLGLAAATDGPVVGLLGDLALLHDLNGLLAARGLHAVICVLDNGGGGIFGLLPQAKLAGFERYWLTPQGVDLQKVAELFGLGFHRVERQSAFVPALRQALESSGVQLVAVSIDREYSLERHRAYWDGRPSVPVARIPPSA